MSDKAIATQESKIANEIWSEIKAAPYSFGISNLKDLIPEGKVFRIVNENAINKIIYLHPVLYSYLKTIEKSGKERDLNLFSVNINYINYKAVNIDHIVIIPDLISGLGRNSDQRISSMIRSVPMKELEDLARTTRLLLFHRKARKELVKDLFDTIIQIMEHTKLLIYKREYLTPLIFHADLELEIQNLLSCLNKILENPSKYYKNNDDIYHLYNHITSGGNT
jgi:hypothetical protein